MAFREGYTSTKKKNKFENYLLVHSGITKRGFRLLKMNEF